MGGNDMIVKVPGLIVIITVAVAQAWWALTTSLSRPKNCDDQNVIKWYKYQKWDQIHVPCLLLLASELHSFHQRLPTARVPSRRSRRKEKRKPHRVPNVVQSLWACSCGGSFPGPLPGPLFWLTLDFLEETNLQSDHLEAQPPRDQLGVASDTLSLVLVQNC